MAFLIVTLRGRRSFDPGVHFAQFTAQGLLFVRAIRNAGYDAVSLIFMPSRLSHLIDLAVDSADPRYERIALRLKFCQIRLIANE